MTRRLAEAHTWGWKTMLIYDDVGGVIPLPDDVSVERGKLVINCKHKMIIMIDLDIIKQVIREENNDSERVSQTDILDRPAN